MCRGYAGDMSFFESILIFSMCNLPNLFCKSQRTLKAKDMAALGPPF